MITPLLLRRLFPSRNLKPRAAWPKGKSRMAKNNQFHITCFVCVSLWKIISFLSRRKKNFCSLFMLHLNIHITHQSVFPRARGEKSVFWREGWTFRKQSAHKVAKAYSQDGSFSSSMYRHLPPLRQNDCPPAGHSFMPSFNGFAVEEKRFRWQSQRSQLDLLVRSVLGLCFDNTSSHVKRETGLFSVSLFLALHSYFPLSFHAADFIMRSDLRLQAKMVDK